MQNGAVRERWVPLQAFAVVMLASATGHAQVAPNAGQVTIPGSSLEKPGDTGVRAHTNIEIFRPNRSPESTEQPGVTSGPRATVPQPPVVPGSSGVNEKTRSQ